MNTATKAVLLSGLLFPGAGHLYLKRYRRGALLISAATAALAIIVAQAVQQARVIADKIVSGEIALDPAAIAAQVQAAASSAESTRAAFAYAVLIACWLIGIIDSYRLGRR